MVITRAQALKRAAMGHQSAEELTMSPDVVTPRRSTRKRTSGITPKARTKGRISSTAKSPATKGKAKGKGKARGKTKQAQQPVVVTTPERHSNRLPTTPKAPRKSDVSTLKSNFPSHLTHSPMASPSSIPLDDMDTMDDLSTLTSLNSPRVRFDFSNLVIVPPPQESNADVGTSTMTMPPSTPSGPNATSFPTRRTPRFLSPLDITSSIPGNWVRSPGQCSQRLVVVSEDGSPRSGYKRELGRQLRYNEIFQEQYDLVANDKEACYQRYREFLRREGMDDGMDI